MDGSVHLEKGAADAPFYLTQGDECDVFTAAYTNKLPVLLKGPTGCGKTRFVAHMAAQLGRPLYTVACHDDLAAADLIGRYLLKGGETVWVDGPLTRAVREGAICYLDEVVEARKDVTVVLHPLTDDRRMLPIDRTGESGLDPDRCAALVRLAGKLRGLKGQDLEEGVSTRLVVYAATLIAQGMSTDRAILAAMVEPLTDDEDIKRGLLDLVTAVFG